jgi:hypothetical protein
MKKLIKLLPLAAIVFGSTLALATTQKMNEPNVYWDGDDWQPLTLLPSQYTCPGAGDCTGFKDDKGNVTEIRPGVFTPN